IHTVGTPGVDEIDQVAQSANRELKRWPLVVLHPETSDDSKEREHALILLKALDAAGIERANLVGSNNDPGWRGIHETWRTMPSSRFDLNENLRRETFLRMMANSAMLIGNSSSGIIEAASLGTMVVNIGDRQKGRERSDNVIDVPWSIPAITKAIKS